MCVDGAADMGKSSARTHGQGKCCPEPNRLQDTCPQGLSFATPPLDLAVGYKLQFQYFMVVIIVIHIPKLYIFRPDILP